MIHESVQKLCARLEKYRGQKDPMPLALAFEALTNDIITEYSTAESTNFLDEPDFAIEWHNMFEKLYIAGPIMQQSPWIADIMQSLPEKVVAWMNPGMRMMFKYQEVGQLSYVCDHSYYMLMGQIDCKKPSQEGHVRKRRLR